MRIKIKRFSDTDEDSEKKQIALGTGVASTATLGSVKAEKLTGKVTRYHGTGAENVENILKEGLKSRYAQDPNNLTNRVLSGKVPEEELKDLIYLTKKKGVARSVNQARQLYADASHYNENFFGQIGLWDYLRLLKDAKKKQKILKLEFDYDAIKNLPKIKNPELRGANNWREFADRAGLDPIDAYINYKALGEDTHIFKGDISPENIVGGAGYKKRTLKQIKNYIKNNPKRFGKEAAKIGVGLGLGAIAAKAAYDIGKKN